MKYKIIVPFVMAAICFTSLLFSRYKHRGEKWTALEKILLVVGVTTIVVTVYIATKDYNNAKLALSSTGKKVVTDQNIYDFLELKDMDTLGDIAKEFNMSPQKARSLTKDLNITHAGEVVRTGADYGWYECKVYAPKEAQIIRDFLKKVA